MALVTNPRGETELRRGTREYEFITINGRNTVRQRAKQTHKPRSHDGVILAQTNAAMHLWQTMTDLQRSAWTAYAAANAPTDWKGNPRQWTSYHAFMAVNASNAHDDIGPVVDPPDDGRPEAPTVVTVEWTGSILKLIYATPPPYFYNVGVRVGKCPEGRTYTPRQRCTRIPTYWSPPNATYFPYDSPDRITIWYAAYGPTSHLYSTWYWITVDLSYY